MDHSALAMAAGTQLWTEPPTSTTDNHIIPGHSYAPSMEYFVSSSTVTAPMDAQLPTLPSNQSMGAAQNTEVPTSYDLSNMLGWSVS